MRFRRKVKYLKKKKKLLYSVKILKYKVTKRVRINRASVKFFNQKRSKYHSYLFRKSLLIRYRHPFFLTIRRKNFFLHTPQTRDLLSIVSLSTGLYTEFRHNVKKKKTRVAGAEIMRDLIDFLYDLRIRTIIFSNKGRLPARKGVLREFKKFLIRFFKYREKSLISFNGTKLRHKRRL
jgi:hypothetical protein